MIADVFKDNFHRRIVAEAAILLIETKMRRVQVDDQRG